MYLKYIEIQGFKSFPDKTKLTFGREITAIVGPNGSGKSNISDAVRWVLGEQSTRSLRSAKMEDVIFGGTQLRKAMGFAQVTLCLDNSDGRIADVGDEITVSRRYYRSGDSEYLINGNTVRLRDVRETFMDTGLSRDGYSIIEQGRISEIVAAKSTDRREIFEEASGIARYRYRKNEAERKLSQAEDNLSRLRDILDELEGRVEPLREQSEKAERFLTLSAERKTMEVTLHCDTLERSKKNVIAQEDRIETAKRDYALIEKRIAEIDDSYIKNSQRSMELSMMSENANVEIGRIGEEINLSERSAATLAAEIAHGEEQAAALRADIASSSETAGELEEKIGGRANELLAEQERMKVIEAEIAGTESELLRMAEEGASSDRRRRDIAARLSALSGELTELRVSALSGQSEAKVEETRAETLRAALPELENREAAQAEYENKLKETAKEIEGEIETDGNRRDGLSFKLQNRREKLGQITGENEQKQARIGEIGYRVAALEDMEKSMEGFAASVRKVMDAGKMRELRGIVGTVSTLISIQKGLEVAIETALAGNMQNIVVEDERAAKDAIRYLRDERAGRATFLPLDTVRPSPFDRNEVLSMPGVVGLGAALVNYDKRYENVISNLLGRVVVAEDLDSASAVAKRLQYRHRVVTKDGQTINAGGSFTGGYLARAAGVFSRRREIEKLSAEREKLEAQLRETAPEKERLEREAVELEAEITVLSSELVNLNTDRVRVQSELRFAASERETATRAKDAAAAELKVSEERAVSLLAGKTAAERQMTETERQIAELENSETDAAAVGDGFLEKRQELTERLSEQKVRRMEKQKDVESIAAALELLRGQQDSETGRAGDIELAIRELERQTELKKNTRAAEETAAAEKRERVAALRRDIEDAVAERMALEKENAAQRGRQGEETKSREDIRAEISRLEERKISLEKDYNSAITQLWEDYELTPAEAAELVVPFGSVTELRAAVGALRNKIRALGNVNVSAIEEYKEVRERYDFLKEQVEDVETSKKQLISLIGTLTFEMREIFIRSFNAINQNFRTVFVEMFMGGSANLSLSDEADVLESGIEIDVQPPGKVIKNLASLSGGEQSLVAIALYFAILKVNPAPFCILDEIDSALDEINVARFAGYLHRLMENTQLISITHRRGTMEAADVLYGVTMQEEGVSKVLKLTVSEAQLAVSV